VSDARYPNEGHWVHANNGWLVHLSKYTKTSPDGGKTWERAYGNWKCVKCGFATEKLQFRPVKCNCESKPLWEYVEVSFQYGALSGHKDFLTRDKRNKWVGWELKTTSLNKLKTASKSLPYPRHIIQIETYCALMWLVYKIRIDRYVIVYVSRDNNYKYHVCGPYKFHDESLDYRSRNIWASQTARSSVRKLLKGNSPKEIQNLIDHRPCFSKKDYNEYMSKLYSDYTEIEACPFLIKGICGKPQVPKMNRLIENQIAKHVNKTKE
jgi:hypothetical protein